MEDRKQRVIVYVDGFNFYFGLKAKKWRQYYWLDLVKFFESFLKPHQELVALKYFSAVQKKCNISILVSADSDLIPPIEAIRELSHQHKLWIYFPPQRYSSDLVSISDRYVKLERHQLKFDDSQLPEELQLKNGFVIKRPKYWK